MREWATRMERCCGTLDWVYEAKRRFSFGFVSTLLTVRPGVIECEARYVHLLTAFRDAQLVSTVCQQQSPCTPPHNTEAHDFR